MAFRSLSKTGRLVVMGGAVAGAGLVVGGIVYPYHKSWYLNLWNVAQASSDVGERCEEGWKKLQDDENCTSLLKKHLTKSVIDKLKTKKTIHGGTLWNVMASGVSNPDASVGVYAPDYESYKMFSDLLDPIINEYHKIGPKDKQPPVDLGEGKLDELPPLDKEGKYIQSTRIRCGRSIQDFPLNTLMTEDDYLVMEQKIKNALTTFKEPELQGNYYPLLGMEKDTQQQLIKDHFLFKDNDRHLRAAGATHYWPKGRGIFHNTSKTFLVWVAEEDHMRIISMQQGGDVGGVLDRLIKGVKAIEQKVPFARDDRLGWYTYCPTNLGSTVRASVHIKLPKVSARKDFEELCKGMNLQVRGIHGEHSAAEGGVYDISNSRRLGLSEYEAVKEMYDGVKKLIEMEEAGGK